VPEVAGVEGRLAEHDGEVFRCAQAEALEHVDQERYRRGVLLRARGAYDLDAGLVELRAPPAADARAAVGREDVGELVRRRAAGQALGDEAGYRGGHLGSEEEHLVVGIEELVGGVAQPWLLYDLGVLERRCDYLPEPEHPEPLPDPGLHVEQARGLRRQHVARARRGGELSGCLALHKRGYLNRWTRL
jgi:hypothetical protein